MPERFTPSRLVLARERRGFTKAMVAKSAGVSIRSITNYEGGWHEPSEGTVQRIAATLGLPTSFFYGGDLTPVPIEAASFRSLKNLTARRRDQAGASATFALALAHWIDKQFTLPETTVPKLRYFADPEAAAELVRREWMLGERPITNMVHLLEAHGVRVFSLTEEAREVDAFSLWIEGVPYVFLNTLKSAEHSRMDAAHELGHLVMHWGHDTPSGRDHEKDAQAFGAAFLMPRGSMLAQAPRTAQLDQLTKAKRIWRVSVANLVYRMHTLGLLSDWQYRTAFTELSVLGYRRAEPEEIPRETSQVLGKVFEALSADNITKTHIADELAIPVDELNRVIFGLSLTPLTGTANPDRFPERPTLSLVEP